MVSKWSRRPFGQNDLIPNWISASRDRKDHSGPLWSEEVHLGPFGSANRTLATPDSHVSSKHEWACLNPGCHEHTGRASGFASVPA